MRQLLELEEYRLLLGIAHELIDDDPAITDKDRTARRMVEAHFRGQLERERLTRERVAA
jgi:hypothetical protein